MNKTNANGSNVVHVVWHSPMLFPILQLNNCWWCVCVPSSWIWFHFLFVCPPMNHKEQLTSLDPQLLLQLTVCSIHSTTINCYASTFIHTSIPANTTQFSLAVCSFFSDCWSLYAILFRKIMYGHFCTQIRRQLYCLYYKTIWTKWRENTRMALQ